MSKLGKLGTFFKKVGKYAPVVLALNPAWAPIAVPVAAAIQEAEAIHGAGSGAEKLAHVTNIAVEAAKAVNAGRDQVVVDPEAIRAGAGAVIGGVITLVNAHPDD